MRYVTIDKIKPGNILAKTVFNNDCNILLSSNNILTDRNINTLKSLGFTGLYIFDHTDDKTVDLLSDEIRQQALRDLQHINIDDCLYIANVITNNILSNPDALHDLLTICSYDTSTYFHSINVAILSVMIGIDIQLKNSQLHELAQAALLHDIGKTCIDTAILNKTSKLTDTEFTIMKNHVVYGYNMLRYNTSISESTRRGILHHHENEDGSGYPSNLKSSEIPLYAKIIHIADVYDAMLSERSYKATINPADVFEYMLGNSAIFDFDILTHLRYCIALYPVGSKVLLSYGSTATVIRNNKHHPQRPLLRRTSDNNIVNLMAVLNLTIVKLLT